MDAQGTRAYARTVCELHPDEDLDQQANDAVTAVSTFVEVLG